MDINLPEYYAFDHAELLWVFNNPQVQAANSLLTREKLLQQTTSLMKNFLNSNFQTFFEDLEESLDIENFLYLYQCFDSYYLRDKPKNSRNVVNHPAYKQSQKDYFRKSKKVPEDVLSLVKTWLPRFEGENVYGYLPKEVAEGCAFYRESIKCRHQTDSKELYFYQVLRKVSGLPSKGSRLDQPVRFLLENEVYSRCKSEVFVRGLAPNHVFKFLSVGIEDKEIKVVPITENITWTIVPINRAHELIS